MQLYPSDQSYSQPAYNLSGMISSGKNSVTIYKGTSPGSVVKFAVKLFSKPKGAEPSAHYLQEEKIVPGLSHPNILRYHSFLPKAMYKQLRLGFKECSAIIMEYIPDGDLFHFISKKPCSEKLARTFLRQMVSALDYLHASGIAHLDIKPENFLISPQGVKLIDFDFSHKLEDTLCQGMKGTLCYRPPEWIKNEMKDYKAADLYSLGVTLFTIVCGWAPYEETEKDKDVFEMDQHFENLMSNREEFWKLHGEFLKKEGREEPSSGFKNLVEGLLKEKPSERTSLEDLKKHEWYGGDIFDSEELECEIKAVLSE